MHQMPKERNNPSSTMSSQEWQGSSQKNENCDLNDKHSRFQF